MPLELRTRDRERKLLKKIMQSLARLDTGDYGYCDETGEPIGLGRLIARPTANLSLEAQQRRELKQKMFGDRWPGRHRPVFFLSVPQANPPPTTEASA